MGKGKRFFLAKFDVLYENQIILEKEREEKEKKNQSKKNHQSMETSTNGMVQAMSQESLKEE